MVYLQGLFQSWILRRSVVPSLDKWWNRLICSIYRMPFGSVYKAAIYTKHVIFYMNESHINQYTVTIPHKFEQRCGQLQGLQGLQTWERGPRHSSFKSSYAWTQKITCLVYPVSSIYMYRISIPYSKPIPDFYPKMKSQISGAWICLSNSRSSSSSWAASDRTWSMPSPSVVQLHTLEVVKAPLDMTQGTGSGH